MKPLKRMLAPLLALVVAVTMVACGESSNDNSGSSSVSASSAVDIEAQIEKTVMDGINGSRNEDVSVLVNDPDLQTKSMDALGYIQNNEKVAAKYAIQVNAELNSVNGIVTVGMVAIVTDELYTYNEDDYALLDEDAMLTPIEVTMDNAEQVALDIVEAESDEEQELIDAITRFGVAAKTINGKTYMAVAFCYNLAS